jgi:hypothetical protein
MSHTQRKRFATDMASAKDVKALVLCYPQAGPGTTLAHAGNIIVCYARTEAQSGGYTAHADVRVWAGPLGDMVPHASTGSAGGSGYCKSSAAISDAILNGYSKDYTPGTARDIYAKLSGRGMGAVRSWLESLGYLVCEVL